MSNQEQNTMYVGVSVIEPPLEVIKVLPDKDACVSLKDCVFNYGKIQEMLVCYSKEQEWRSLLTFTVQKLEPLAISNLKYAILHFNLSSPASRDMTLTIAFHNNTKWAETGITWLSMPSVYKVYKSVDIKKGDSKIEVDISDIISENDELTVYGLTLYEFNLEDQTKSLDIRTKESSLPPYIEYAYKVFPDNMDLTSLESSAIVTAFDDIDLNARFDIKGGIEAYDGLTTSVSVKGYEDELYIDSYALVYHANPTYELDASTKVKEYDGDLHLDISSQIYKTQNEYDLLSNYNVNEYGDKLDIDSKATVYSQIKFLDIKSGCSVNEYKDSLDITSSATVYQIVNSDTNEDDSGGDNPSPITKAQNTIAAMANIKEYEGFSDLDTNIGAVYPVVTMDIPTSFNVPNHEATMSDLEASAIARAYTDLEANTNVYQNTKVELTTRCTVYPSYYHDLDVVVNIDLNLKKPYAFIM